MIDFKPIQLKDKEWIDEILSQCDYMSCSNSFGNNFIWKKVYDICVAKVNGFYVARFTDGEGTSFMYPAGVGDISKTIDTIIDHCKEADQPLIFSGMIDSQQQELSRLYPNRFNIQQNRDMADYIYLRESLATLAGKKLHGKRNHIKRFKDNDWCFEPINDDNIDECVAMNKQWCILNNCNEDPQKQLEACAVKRSLKYFNELEFFGGLLRVDGEVVAYTIAERLSVNTVVVHIEKAFSSVQGAYPTINQEFILNMASEYTYVNREEDMGVEGLRKAKMSYYPEFLLDKYHAKLI